MKTFALLCMILLQGCTTMGNTEALNDAGLGDAREAISVFTTTKEVLGIPVERNRAPTINRGYGHIENMKGYPEDVEDVPFTVKEYIELERYIRGILK